MTPLNPSLDEFRRLAASGNVVPVFAEFVVDAETPISAFKKLCRNGHSFLFESTEKNDVSGRFSFLGIESHAIIQSYGRQIVIVTKGHEQRFATANDPLDEVRRLLQSYNFVSRPDLPRFSGGAVGFLGYEGIRFFEAKVPG